MQRSSEVSTRAPGGLSHFRGKRYSEGPTQLSDFHRSEFAHIIGQEGLG